MGRDPSRGGGSDHSTSCVMRTTHLKRTISRFLYPFKDVPLQQQHPQRQQQQQQQQQQPPRADSMGLVTTPVAPEDDTGRPMTSHPIDGPPDGEGVAARSPVNERDRAERRPSRFNSLTSAASLNSTIDHDQCSSVGSVTPTASASASYSDVSEFFRGAPGLGTADASIDRSNDARRRSRRATKARSSKFKGGSSKRNVFVPKPPELPSGRMAFFTEIFRLKGTIVLRVVPQMILAALMGLFANVVKLVYCGNDVRSNEVGGIGKFTSFSVFPCGHCLLISKPRNK